MTTFRYSFLRSKAVDLQKRKPNVVNKRASDVAVLPDSLCKVMLLKILKRSFVTSIFLHDFIEYDTECKPKL